MSCPYTEPIKTISPFLFRGGGVVSALLTLALISGCTDETTSATNNQLTDISEQAGVIFDFEPHPPGSYKLYDITPAPGGKVLDTDGQARDLSEFLGGKVTLLSFIYSSCADPRGCPYAYSVFHYLQNKLEQDPKFNNKVRLVSLSFDPVRDTPEVLKLYAGNNAKTGSGTEWNFLTTSSLDNLLPILGAYGQDVYIDIDPVTKQPLSTMSHVLKIFLVDKNSVVREIYTASYLAPEVVYNDILTLLMEDGLKLP